MATGPAGGILKKHSRSPNGRGHAPRRAALRLMVFAGLFSLWFASSSHAAAEDAEKRPVDKNVYNLFNPVPESMMRELNPDRPDKTEGPYTVDAGHCQLEMSFVEFTRSQSDSVRADTWNVAPVNFKVGLSAHADLQLLFDSYLNVHTRDLTAGTTSTQSGVGDITMRLKMNLWGNDGGKTAFAILPYVKFPVNTDHLGNNSVEGGIIFPLGVQLAEGWDLGVETAATILRNVADHGYHPEFINSMTLHRDLFGTLTGYAEFFSSVSTEHDSGWVGTVDIGLLYGLTKNILLDCGVNVGVTRSADDVNAFTGVTMRF